MQTFFLDCTKLLTKPILTSCQLDPSRPISVNLKKYIDFHHYNDVIMGRMASQINSLTIVYSTVYSGARLFRRRSMKTSKLRVTGLCAWNSPVTGESPHKWSVTWTMFPFDDVIMFTKNNVKMWFWLHWVYGLHPIIKISISVQHILWNKPRLFELWIICPCPVWLLHVFWGIPM